MDVIRWLPSQVSDLRVFVILPLKGPLIDAALTQIPSCGSGIIVRAAERWFHTKY